MLRAYLLTLGQFLCTKGKERCPPNPAFRYHIFLSLKVYQCYSFAEQLLMILHWDFSDLGPRFFRGSFIRLPNFVRVITFFQRRSPPGKNPSQIFYQPRCMRGLDYWWRKGWGTYDLMYHFILRWEWLILPVFEVNPIFAVRDRLYPRASASVCLMDGLPCELRFWILCPILFHLVGE